MIVDRNTDDLTRTHKPSRQLDIVPARFELTAGMVVINHDRRGTVVQRATKEIGRIDGRLGAGAEAEFVAADQPVPTVNAQKPEDLAAFDLQPSQQVVADNRRITEDLRLTEPGARDPVTELEAGEDGGGLGGPDAADAEEFGCIPPSELRKAAGGYKNGVGLDHRAATLPTGSHQHRQQLRIRKNRGTDLEQSLTRP